ncbi:unnamed protein product [Candidula unifasciata]|uniref:Uncharacterized protein n=1 Tax=Candidula unifasciata TaxID=100452 RepID=A0A8S3ZU67_9EUPU|nr:unnamed protein product [Candidula unifasciata]
MMSKKYQLLLLVFVMTVLSSMAQPNTVINEESARLVNRKEFDSAARSQLREASGLSDAVGGSQKQRSSAAIKTITRIERSSSDEQLMPENVLSQDSIGQTSTPTSTSPETSTEYPYDCRPRKSLDQTRRSTILTDADLSVAMEMCTGVNEELFTKLWSNMNFMKMEHNSTVTVPSAVTKDNHAKDQQPRKVVIKTVTVSHEKMGTVCVSLVSDYMETGMYLLLNSANGTSVYLVTQKKGGIVFPSRLVLNSSLEDMTTILLATSKHWRVSGSSGAANHIKGQHEIVISLENITVTLFRSAIGERVYYEITIQLKAPDMAYGGILGDLLAAKSASLANKPMKPKGQQRCKPAATLKLTKHRASFCTFMGYLLGLLDDLAHNLPSTIFE